MKRLRKTIAIGYPVGLGQLKKGVERTPRKLFTQQWFRKLTDGQITTIEETPSGTMDKRSLQAHILEKNRQLSLDVAQCLQKNYFPIVVGGCHTQAIGSVSGAAAQFKGERLRVVWIDAHFDANTPQDSVSGNYHGMPLGILSGSSVQVPLQKAISLDDVIYVGVRSWDKAEFGRVQSSKAKVYGSHLCNMWTLRDIVKEIEARIGDDPLWVSLDFDAICPYEFRATGTPAPFGLESEFVSKLLESLLPRAVGCDLSEINFDEDSQNFKENIDVVRKVIESPLNKVRGISNDALCLYR